MCCVGGVGICCGRHTGQWYNTTMYKYKKYCTIHNTDTVAYATHSGSYSAECKRKYTTHWYICGTQQLQQYTTFTAMYNTYMSQKYLGYLNVKLLQP